MNGRPAPEAFNLRTGEAYLSTNWLEFFQSSDRQLQVSGVHRILEEKGFRVNRNGGFAILNVGATTQTVRSVALQFLLLGETYDPSHIGVFGIPGNDADISVAIAKSVQDFVPAG